MINKFTLLIMFICFVNNIIISQVTEQDSIKVDSLMRSSDKKLLDNSDSIKDASKPTILIQNDENELLKLSKDTIVRDADKEQLDTTDLYARKKGKPVIATLCSTFIPGLGQAYNKKFWKIPIIYSIFGSMYFFATNNHQKYKDFKYAYKNFDTDLKPVWVSKNINKKYLKNRMEFYKRNRNFNIIIGGIIYLLNILDANVDAHLMDFDVGGSLSLRLEPEVNHIYKFNSHFSKFGMKFVIAFNNKNQQKALYKR